MNENKHVVLIAGPPNTGKSYGVHNLPQSSMVNLNADNKAVPFKSNFMHNVYIKDAMQLLAFVKDIEKEPSCTGAVLDTLTFAMGLYERQYVLPRAGGKEGQKAWGDYGNFYRELLHGIKTGTKNYAIMAHLETKLNEQLHQMESRVPIKGAVGQIGVEADFSVVLYSMVVPVSKLEGKEHPLLTITPDEREDGVKYVYVTRSTQEYLGSKIRSPVNMWSRNEQYINNDLKLVFDRLDQFHGKP